MTVAAATFACGCERSAGNGEDGVSVAEQDIEYEQYTPQTSGRLFNSAMFGFNKEEVLEYLEELADENYQRQEQAENRIQELSRKIQMLENAAVANAKQAPPNAANPKELEAARAKMQQLKQDLDIAKAATQQSEEELLQYKEQLYNAQQENNWLREEYQKCDHQIAELRRQLDDASSGQWSEAEGQIGQLRHQLDEALQAQHKLTLDLQEAHQIQQQLEDELDDMQHSGHNNGAYYQDNSVNQAASVILADAQAEAERIRAEAYEEKERIRRQILSSAGGLADSVASLREDVSDVEGDVSSVLESVQHALAQVLSALGRTEQGLSSLGVQAERFPASAPSVVKNQPPVVYFQPGAQVAAAPPQPAPAPHPSHPAASLATSKVSPAQSYDGGNFRRVWPDEEEPPRANTRPFRPSYSNSPTPFVVAGAEAFQQQEDPMTQERLRALSETLVDTLRQMLN